MVLSTASPFRTSALHTTTLGVSMSIRLDGSTAQLLYHKKCNPARIAEKTSVSSSSYVLCGAICVNK